MESEGREDGASGRRNHQREYMVHDGEWRNRGGNGIMAQDLKYSSSGRMKISAGYKTGNMAAFMYAGTKRKRKKRVKGK